MKEDGHRIVSNWMHLGYITHGFLHHRFDSERQYDFNPKTGEWEVLETPTLLEQFGFKRISEASKFGSGFIFSANSLSNYLPWTTLDTRPYASETIQIYRRGIRIISNPEYGTLVVRNSSLAFGRDLLNYPAYYTSMYLDKYLCAVLDLDMIKTVFLPVASPYLNSVGQNSVDASPEIQFLISQYFQLSTTYAMWKFGTDPEKIVKGTNTEDLVFDDDVIGAYKADGFAAVVEFLINRFNALNKFNEYCRREGNNNLSAPCVMPDLAFVNPFLPPWTPYSYEFSGAAAMLDKSVLQRFSPDSFSLNIMNGFLSPEDRIRVHEQEVNNELGIDLSGLDISGFRDFYQNAGINNPFSCLTLIPPV